MDRSSSQSILIFVALLLAAAALVPAQAQDNTCTVSIRMFNDNRYAYDTDEECPGGIHSVPFGNWGISSNVGRKEDKHQFQGWYPSCYVYGDSKVEWNSCSVGYVKPDLDCRRLNFPDKSGSYPFPANGYPFSDVYSHNNCATGSFPCTCVDQFSPCGPNDYGGTSYRFYVSAPYDSDCDGFVDAGGDTRTPCCGCSAWVQRLSSSGSSFPPPSWLSFAELRRRMPHDSQRHRQCGGRRRHLAVRPSRKPSNSSVNDTAPPTASTRRAVREGARSTSARAM